ncbi:Flagella synthesis protein [Azotobacter vinelandii CA]|uniref:Flagella synthesis protein n=2 Tax=Azotobacter vinelandii TaxID=354 RepID=C1DHI9_AZOVD|nr:flagellar protein FlgN [Azotobacter vinelandii]ACO78584.1 Flagella synthesis protein [Azotobacter vinelandii DJ]AGK13483.1 Flagella synthesis protein [Azotobacter vinelandii CA]AGK17896.1 Flagella synthesis protein [Azotobacter vinelandii CA6]WKN24266.1 flagellar protein FlgN [Azotobacter vinelandii]SFX89456.1 flagella synthesis protein FlgN [Azotobacter vinelandii]
MSLSKHLATQRQTLQRFVELLEEERQALTEAAVDGQRLADLAAAKRTLLGELEHLEKQRGNAQARLGYSAGRRGAEQAASDAGCLPAWQQLLELAGHAQLLNRLNGDTIRTRLGHNQRILNFLHEAAGHSLYGPDGRTRRGGNLGGLSG